MHVEQIHRLRTLEPWLDSTVPRLLKKYDVSGVAMAIIRDGELAFSKIFITPGSTPKIALEAGLLMHPLSLKKGHVDFNAGNFFCIYLKQVFTQYNYVRFFAHFD